MLPRGIMSSAARWPDWYAPCTVAAQVGLVCFLNSEIAEGSRFLGIPRGVTLPPIIMEVRKSGSLPIVVPFQIQPFFHFHDCGRKSNSGKQRARFPEKNNLEKTVVSRTLLFPNQPFFLVGSIFTWGKKSNGSSSHFFGGSKEDNKRICIYIYTDLMRSTWDHLDQLILRKLRKTALASVKQTSWKIHWRYI